MGIWGTVDQNTVRQLDGIEVERIFIDKASGKDTTHPQLEELIGFVRDGDTVIVHSMDRLARNLDDLRQLVRTPDRRQFAGQDVAASSRKYA